MSSTGHNVTVWSAQSAKEKSFRTWQTNLQKKIDIVLVWHLKTSSYKIGKDTNQLLGVQLQFLISIIEDTETLQKVQSNTNLL